MTETNLAVWSGSQAEVFDLGEEEAHRIAGFDTTAKSMAFRGNYLYRAVGSAVEKCNIQGRLVQGGRLTFTETEGYPIHMDITDRFLAVATSLGFLKIYDLDKREKDMSGPGGSSNGVSVPKQLGSSGRFVDAESGALLGMIRSIACNANGSRISILSDRVRGAMKIREPDSKLYVYDADRDVVEHLDCVDASQSRYPVSHFWDAMEPKLLAIETRRRVSGVADAPGEPRGRARAREESKTLSPRSPKNGGAARDFGRSPARGQDAEAFQQLQKVKNGAGVQRESEGEIRTLFVTSDHGIQMQDTFPLEAPLEALIGCRVPCLYFSTIPESGGQPGLQSSVLHDFVGLEDVDDETKKALLDFSYFLTIKNMDEAHRAVKLIKNPSVWENMAHMCVKTKRIDVAEVCLGNMGFARGAASVRLAKKEPEVEARVAAVAVQLGRIHDADRLYRECNRFDLLNQLYQASGCWDRALEVAAENDRIHLKTTHHQFAKHLEDVGDIGRAVKHFEYADTHRTQVPRMLFDRQRLGDLEEYIGRSNDSDLLKWWAGYCESLGQYDKARHFYQRAGDQFSLVRIACFNGDIAKAKQIIEESGDGAASYYLARYLEGMSEVREAISYYALSKCYNHAIRLAKNFGLDSELMSFALKAQPALMIECAQYFEAKGEFEKAVQLYQKGGDIPKSLDLCFKAGNQGRTSMFDVLRTIASELDENANPQTVARCAEFFIEHGQFEKAVQLFITGKRYTRAIELCVQHKVKITEEMAEGLTPPKEPATDSRGEGGVGNGDYRNEVLRSLARACKKQGSYQLACKKFTQAQDRVKAMKCLLKSGDTKNITYYATVSRNPEIYILAANYLQSLDWQNAPDTMKNIVLFYTKAKAFEQLSSFFDAFAQMEIDEYRDYEKALNALKKASEYMQKAKVPDREHQLAQYQQRIYHIEQFVMARSAAKDDPSSMVRICHALLEQPDVEAALRVGDCYALLVEFYHGQGNYDAAYRLIESMRARQIVLHPYLEQDMIEEIHNRVGVAVSRESPRQVDDEDDGGVAEELDEEVDEIESDGEFPHANGK